MGPTQTKDPIIKNSKTDLEKVSHQFDLWRKKRRNQRSPIPDDLWRAAVDLCKSYRISQIRSELGLDYGKLRSKVAELGKIKGQPEFINIDLPARSDTNPVVEWVRPDGAKLRVRVSLSQLNQVVTEFFGGQP